MVGCRRDASGEHDCWIQTFNVALYNRTERPSTPDFRITSGITSCRLGKWNALIGREVGANEQVIDLLSRSSRRD